MLDSALADSQETTADHPRTQRQRPGEATSQRIQQLLAEASSVTATESGKNIELQLGHFCNNRCVFCASGQLTEQGQAGEVGFEQIGVALERAHAGGFTQVTFLGGEPTIQESFLPALARAVDLGFEKIIIFSNGVRAGDLDFVEEVSSLGNFAWRISIQGGNREAHDEATGRKGAFKRMVRGLGLLHERGHEITANMCVNTTSYESLPDLPDLLIDHGIQQMCVDMVRPVSTGIRTKEYLASIVPRFTDMAPFIDQMLARFEERDPNYDINITHLPYCILPKWSHRISHGGEPTVTFTADVDNTQGVQNKYEFQAGDRGFVPACEGCLFQHRCTGIPHDYVDIYGDEEFQAVSLEDLEGPELRRANFVDCTENSWSALASSTPPADWALEAVERDFRQRQVEFRFRHEQGQVAKLWLMATGVDVSNRQLHLAAGKEIQLVLDPGYEPPLDSLLALRSWARDVLTQRGDLESGLETDMVRRAIQRQRAARSWLLRFRDRLDSVPGLGEWTVGVAESTPDQLTLLLKRESGLGLRIEVSTVPKPTGPPLSFAVISRTGINDADLAVVSKALGAALREGQL